MVLRSAALLTVVLVAACQPAAPATPTPTATTTTPPTAVPVAKPSAAPSPTSLSSPVAAPKPSAVPSPSAPTQAAPPVGSSRADVLNAANAAFTRGDLTSASQLYERVVNTPPTGESPQQATAVLGFAHFRAAIALLAAGDERQARTHVDALQSADATSPFARLANQLWDQYGMVGSLRGACAQLQPQIASQAGPTLQVLQGLGVSVEAQSLCTVPNR